MDTTEVMAYSTYQTLARVLIAINVYEPTSEIRIRTTLYVGHFLWFRIERFYTVEP